MPESTTLDEDRDIFELEDAPVRTRVREKLTDKELEERYDSGEFHVVTEKNDFLLPQIRDFVESHQWINLRPQYQRRKRWDDKKKSLLIESFLTNVPIPPIYLYETDLARYEVMDGQQRLNAVLEFYNNELKLKGLEIWPALNGKTYAKCPPRIQRGLDRRKLSAVILQAESERGTGPDPLYLRRIVFHRLNTGGEKLNPQELRNAFFVGRFNDLILKLSRLRLFTDIWRIPSYEEYERPDGYVGEPRKSNTLYKTMNDCQIVLRFFAFREEKHVKGSVMSILDNCMKRHLNIDDELLDEYEGIFISRLNLAYAVFGENTFRLPSQNRRRGRLSNPLYDAVMVALDQLWDQQAVILRNKMPIRKRLAQLLRKEEFYEIVVGRPNTAKEILARIRLVRELIEAELR